MNGSFENGAWRRLAVILAIAGLTLGCVLQGGPAAARELHQAAREGRVEDVKRVLEQQPELVGTTDGDGETALHEAVERDHLAVAELLIAGGADVNARDLDGETPMREAAAIGSVDGLELLLAAGAEVDAADADGDTPLHKAAQYGQTAAVELLIVHGARTDMRNADGETPLDRAREESAADVVVLLERLVAKPGE